ncbi:MAG: 1-deoxy-D-xylulose-5-phosphate synthase N-terminal domain-containing protein, partial [Gammaproteobacteria bacterium]
MPLSNDYPLLNSIHNPPDIRLLGKTQLRQLADEVRAYLTHTVSISGGH